METFRELFTRLVFPLGRLLAVLRISPNAVSLSGIVFGIVSAYCYVSHQFFWAVCFFVASGLSDLVDGTVAKLRGIGSSFGAYFDNFCGGYTDGAVFCGLIGAGLCSPGWGALAIVGTLMRMLTFRLPAIIAPKEGEAPYTRFPYALGGKADRIIIIGLGTMLGRIPAAVIVVAVLTNGIAVARTVYCHQLAKRSVVP